MSIKRITLAMAVTCLMIGIQPSFAKDVASVNGTAIPDSQYNQILNQALRQGQKDSPELRNAIKD